MKCAIRHTLIVLALAFAGEASAAEWRSYNNARFGFAIDYPADLLIMQPPPANGDGRTFRSADWRIVATASGAFNALNQSMVEQHRAVLKDYAGARIIYKRRGPDFFVLSGRRKESLFYDYVVMTRKGGSEVIGRFRITYPANARRRLAPVVARMQKSFADSFRRLPLER